MDELKIKRFAEIPQVNELQDEDTLVFFNNEEGILQQIDNKKVLVVDGSGGDSISQDPVIYYIAVNIDAQPLAQYLFKPNLDTSIAYFWTSVDELIQDLNADEPTHGLPQNTGLKLAYEGQKTRIGVVLFHTVEAAEEGQSYEFFTNSIWYYDLNAIYKGATMPENLVEGGGISYDMGNYYSSIQANNLNIMTDMRQFDGNLQIEIIKLGMQEVTPRE